MSYLVEVRDNPKNTAVKGNPVHIAKWNRVLEALGHDTGTGVAPMAASVIHANAAQWPDSPFKAASVYLKSQEQQQEPAVTVSAGASAVTEGGSATFTLTATPPPAADLSVSVTVATDGDYGVAAGERTVTVPTTGSITLTLPTTGDDADEPDGSVSVTVEDGDGYTVGSAASGSITIADDDAPAPEVATVDPALIAQVRTLAGQTQHGQAHVDRWRRVLVAFGVEAYPGLAPTTAAEAEANARKYSSPLWPQIAEVLAKLEAASEPDTPPVTVPAVRIAGGAAVTEGGDAVFTVTATPAPSADLPVTVAVATGGDWGISAGTRTVTVPTTGSATLTLATTDDAADEPDGSLSVTVQTGSGYTVGAPASGSVTVRDDDLPPPDTPAVTLSAGSAVTEGGDAVFTLTATPAPAADLPVSVAVATDGDYGIAAGTQTVTIPTTGSATLTLATTDDAADEPDGSVTVTVTDGSGYTVGDPASGTVVLRDDDVPVVTVSAGSAVTEGGNATFTLTANPAPAAPLAVSVTVATAGEYGVTAGQRTVTLPTTGSVTLTLATTDDTTDEPDGSATVTVEPGAGYTVGAPASASVEVTDDDAPSAAPALSVGDSTAKEGARLPVMSFTVRLSPPAPAPVRVYVSTRPSTPVSAEPGRDYAPGSSDLTFRGGGDGEAGVDTDLRRQPRRGGGDVRGGALAGAGRDHRRRRGGGDHRERRPDAGGVARAVRAHRRRAGARRDCAPHVRAARAGDAGHVGGPGARLSMRPPAAPPERGPGRAPARAMGRPGLRPSAGSGARALADIAQAFGGHSPAGPAMGASTTASVTDAAGFDNVLR